jgi:hypothetical protein
MDRQIFRQATAYAAVENRATQGVQGVRVADLSTEQRWQRRMRHIGSVRAATGDGIDKIGNSGSW